MINSIVIRQRYSTSCELMDCGTNMLQDINEQEIACGYLSAMKGCGKCLTNMTKEKRELNGRELSSKQEIINSEWGAGDMPTSFSRFKYTAGEPLKYDNFTRRICL